ncbi:MAG: UDP-N-acetylmuramoyl-tripeptide--D-alanyl-D-alanine ligase [Pseudomonadota bacterium]|nr:UDP-N-acetylmuramoyl-tripeptide--D-alanyl-D-alanine ligase [Pseudomonadota bacterium]
MFTLGEAAIWLDGARVIGDAATAISRVHSDTRTLRAGDLFVALRGERFDAHAFLGDAKARGAAAVLGERDLAAAGMAGIEVADSRLALGQMAASWRNRFDLPLIAVTGSNGKTTVTQMIASIFRAWQGDAAFATEGNLNNDVGVPLTLLRLRASHRAGVVELGMNHPGEIATLAAMAQPTVALVNNAQREHLEFMASVDAVAKENGAAIEVLEADGVAVFPADDAHASIWRSLAGARRTLTFAEGGDADVTGSASAIGEGWHLTANTPRGPIEFDLHVAGRHNVRNALAATASALAAGCPPGAIGRGLAAFRPVRGRSQSRRFSWQGSERVLVDDSYNANPDSVRAAIDVLATLPAPRWLVLGDMGEVGTQGPAFHREVGAYAASLGIDALWAVGPESANTAAPFADARAFAGVEAVLASLGESPPFATVLVKGSRFMKMERVVAALEGVAAGDAHAA